MLDFEQEFISRIGINLVTLIWQCLCEFDTVYYIVVLYAVLVLLEDVRPRYE